MLRAVNYLSIVATSFLLLLLYKAVVEIYPGPPEYASRTHISLYLDRNFDDTEVDAITGAALEWSVMTNHIVEYDVIQLPTEDDIDYSNGLFVVKASPDDPRILLMDYASKNITLGLYDRSIIPTIYIVADRIDVDLYKEVVLHEIGHSLGLAHLEGIENVNALMYPSTNFLLPDGSSVDAGSPIITPKDLESFCKIYDCAGRLEY